MFESGERTKYKKDKQNEQIKHTITNIILKGMNIAYMFVF